MLFWDSPERNKYLVIINALREYDEDITNREILMAKGQDKGNDKGKDKTKPKLTTKEKQDKKKEKGKKQY